jgi:chemotaxis protein CheY-P-specific phosphatase CheC
VKQSGGSIGKNNSKATTLTQNEVNELGENISMLVSETSKTLAMMTGEEYIYSFGRISEVKPEFVDHLVQLFAGEVCSVYLKADGDITVGMMLFLTREHAHRLAGRLLGDNNLNELDGLGKSSISEVGNVLFAGSFLNSISRYTGFQMNCSVPGFATDAIHQVIQLPIKDISRVDDKTLIAQSELFGKETGTTLKLLIILAVSDGRKLISSMDQMIDNARVGKKQ